MDGPWKDMEGMESGDAMGGVGPLRATEREWRCNELGGSWKVTEAWDGTPAAAPSAAASAARAQSPPPDAAAGGGTGSEVRGQRSEYKVRGQNRGRAL